MSSLVRCLYEDKDAQGLLKVGTTSGSVEDRIARAETQSTFLFAPVAVVETYELTGHSAKEAEQCIHRALRPYHTALRVTGPDGRSFSATEWFKAPPEVVGAAIQSALA